MKIGKIIRIIDRNPVMLLGAITIVVTFVLLLIVKIFTS